MSKWDIRDDVRVIKFRAGTDIHRAIEQAYTLSRLEEQTVIFNFNGVWMICDYPDIIDNKINEYMSKL